jgi:hypothetical protein
MANTAEKYGLRPVRKLDGSPFINAQNRYRIAANYGTQIFQGDLVQPTAAGGIEKHTGGTSDAVVGVFNGVFYTDPTTQKPTWKNYYPGTVNASDIVATVIDDPEVVYSIDSDGAFAVADIFQNFSVTNTTGSTLTGISTAQLDYSTAGTSSVLTLQAIDIAQTVGEDEAGSANVDVLVRINRHFFGYAQGGVGV